MSGGVLSIRGVNENSTVMISDLAGRVAYSGKSKEYTPPCGGIYIIECEGKKAKVLVP